MTLSQTLDRAASAFPDRPLVNTDERSYTYGEIQERSRRIAAGLVEHGVGPGDHVAASFGLPEVKRGLIAGSGGLLRLPRHIPPQIAMDYALTGMDCRLPRPTAGGSSTRLSHPGDAVTVACELGVSIAANAPLSLEFTKELVSHAAAWSEEETWARQRELLDTVVASADAREGADAFLHKRPPRWTGA